LERRYEKSVGLKEMSERLLGTSIPPREWDEAKTRAERKLQRIISREGDANGCRREPGYLAQLIAEAIRERRFSRFTYELMETLEAKEKPAARAASNSITSVSIVAEYI